MNSPLTEEKLFELWKEVKSRMASARRYRYCPADCREAEILPLENGGFGLAYVRRFARNNCWYFTAIVFDGSLFWLISDHEMLKLNRKQIQHYAESKAIEWPSKGSASDFENLLIGTGEWLNDSEYPTLPGKSTDRLRTIASLSMEDIVRLKEQYFGLIATKNVESDTESPFLLKIKKYAFRKHVLVEGEKGSGKTYEIDKYVKSQGIACEFIGGHEGVESIDLLGHLVKFQDNLIWKDGPLASAFRKATAGTKTALFIDEMLRIPSRELNILVAALTPNSENQYVLRTGNIVGIENGVAVEETLTVSCENLWAVGTTNVGVGYQVDELDEALADRFRIIRKDNNRDEIKKILINAAGKTKKELVKGLMSFYDVFQRLRKQGQISKVLNLRHLKEVLELSVNEEELVENLFDMALVWVERTPEGYPEPEQMHIIEKAIGDTFPSFVS